MTITVVIPARGRGGSATAITDVSGSPFTLTGSWQQVCTTTSSTAALLIGDTSTRPAQFDAFWTVVVAGASAPGAGVKGFPVGEMKDFSGGIPIGDIYARSDSGAVISVATG